eukprot:GEMP01018632.1.p1 GENE.GEMP01018632.1~~GEMP01018632.1.p1  ORF type:complete len:490 (+),score=97.43 GEMP01018632.1:111-1580(+)
MSSAAITTAGEELSTALVGEQSTADRPAIASTGIGDMEEEGRSLTVATADGDIEQQDDDPDTRSCFDRWFGPMNEGSMRTFVFALCNTAFGSGVLMLPWVFAVCGIPLATLLLLVSACLSIVSLRMLANAANVTSIPDYEGVVRYTLGVGMSRFLNGLIFCYCFGSVCSYFIFMGQFSKPVLRNIDIDPPRWLFLIVMLCLLYVPSTLSLSDLRYPNLFAVMCLPVVMLCIVASFFKQKDARSEWYDIAPNTTGGTVVKCVAICFYAFSCHVSLFAAYGDFRNPVPRRVQKALLRAVGIQASVYWVVGVCGFLAFGDPCEGKDPEQWHHCTPSNVLAVRSFIGPLSIVSRMAMFGVLFVSIPINVFAAREQVLPRSASVWIPDLRNKVFIYTILFTGVAVLLAMTKLELHNLLSVTGGLGAVTFMFTLPLLVTCKLREMRLVTSESREGLIGNFVGITKRGVLAAAAMLVPAIVIGYTAAGFGLVALFN